MNSPALFQPLALRELSLKNRIVVSPMCQYSADYGVPNDGHLVHLGRFALGGAGLVMTEATAVEPEGRISAGDTGLWNERQQLAFSRIVRFIKDNGAGAGIQLAHAGRKASTRAPWLGGGPAKASDARNGEVWTPLAPSALPFTDGYPTPNEMTGGDIARIRTAFADATRRALAADFDVVEVHGAHGYLLTQFLSPISNQRRDDYGGGLAGRMRLTLEIVREVRGLWPSSRPLFVRISAVDGTKDGWSLEDSVLLCRELRSLGVDVIDCSAGGITPSMVTLPDASQPNYQVPFAARIKRDAGIATMAVGRIGDPDQANDIVASGCADLVALGRPLLDDPNWPLHAREKLLPEGLGDAAYPHQVGYAVKSFKRPPR